MLSIVVCFCFKDVPTFFEPWAGFSPAFFAPDLFWVPFFARRRKLTVPRWSIHNFWMFEAGTALDSSGHAQTYIIYIYKLYYITVYSIMLCQLCYVICYILYIIYYILYIIYTYYADFHGGSTGAPEDCSNKFLKKQGDSCDILPGTCSRSSTATFLRSLKKRSGRDHESEMLRPWAILRCIYSKHTKHTKHIRTTFNCDSILLSYDWYESLASTVCLLFDGFMGCEWAVRMQMVQLQRHCGDYW